MMLRATVVAVLVLLAVTLACQQGHMGMMGEEGHMSGREMMEMMRDPDVMNEWMGEMLDDPELTGRMMEHMHRRMRERGVRNGGTVYCPMMGFTPEKPPEREPEYDPTSISARELFLQKCARCHALPDPGRHTDDEWADTVQRMARYAEAVEFVSVTPDELDRIVGYLRERAPSS